MSLSSAAIIRLIVPVMRRMNPFPHICASYVTSVPADFGLGRKLKSPFIAFASTWRPSADGGWELEALIVDCMMRVSALRGSWRGVPGGNGPGVAEVMALISGRRR